MTDKLFTGIKIICTPVLPVEIPNEETKELETFHMVAKGDILYVSEELGNALNNRFGDMDD